MYQQPTHGPAVPAVIRHIYLAKPVKQLRPAPPPTGILAELAALGRH